tara:strand:- start:1179 stop:2312 length:1134 start_codon:yes stop_codon:yes gene_type:complete
MNITYITYQGIPSYNTFAYGICTFSTIKHFVKNNFKVNLIFPLREKNATTNISVLQEFYEMYLDFEINPTKHYLPFGRIKIFEKYMYIISHILWAYYVTRKIKKNETNIIFTLSDWVFYFLSRKNVRVVYECHDLTNIRKKLVSKSLTSNNSKIICINKYIKDDLNLKESSNVIVLENGYDEDIFYNNPEKNGKMKIVYSGNLQRFGKNRGVDEIIEYFLESRFRDIFELHIFGGPDEAANELKKHFKDDSLFIHGHTKRSELSKVLSMSHFGILTNINSVHAQRHTSPVKYYEYLGSGMKVIATNSLAHKELPFQNEINYFDLEDKQSFQEALEVASKAYDNTEKIDISALTLEYRMSRVIDFIEARPEGLEPSTP